MIFNALKVRFCFLVCLIAFASSGLGQNQKPNYSISGIVTDSASKEAIEFATIIAKVQPQDSLITGAITKANGQFVINNLRAGDYIVEIAFMGYSKKKSALIQLSSQKPIAQLGKISLSPSQVTLKDVEITARQDFMTNSIDKKEYNVEKNITAAGGSANDLLNTIPSVSVDMDGNVSLRGNSNVTVLVDGKPSALTGASRSAMLAQIPGSSIKSIEVITNPSARYDPDGMSGIINIVTKKNKKAGINGGVTLGVGTRNKYNGAANLNYRNRKFNAYTNFSYRNEDRFRRSNSFTYTPADTVSPYIDQVKDGTRQRINYMGQAGIDFYLTERTTIGFSANLNAGSGKGKEVNSFVETDPNGLPYSVYERPNHGTSSNSGYQVESSFQKRFSQKGRSLDARFSYGSNEQSDDVFYRTIYTLEDGQAANTLNENQNNFRTDETQLGIGQIDYVHPLSEKAKFETGAKVTSRDLLNSFISESMDPNSGEFEPDTLLNNTFKYTERIYAAYGIYGRQLSEQWALQLGLRAEQAQTKSHLLNDNSIFKNNYFKLFPNAYLSWKPKKKQEFRFSYSRRINRPRTRQLNPFTNFSNPKRFRTGNPNLLPETIDAFELSSNKKFKWGSLNASVYYRYLTNTFSRYLENIGGDTLLISFVNFANSHDFGAEIIAQVKPAKWLDLTASGNFFQLVLDASNIDPELGSSYIGVESKLMANVYFSKKTSLQTTANYRSPRQGVQGRFAAMFFSDIALKQTILKGKGSVSLRLSDIANTRRFKVFADTDDIITDFYFKRESQIVYLTFNYRFGKQNMSGKRKRSRQSGDGGGDGGGF